MISVTGQYAIRAVVYLAEVQGECKTTAGRIAAHVGVPANYLAKILHALVHAGILDSARGPHGGFRLLRPAGDLMLAEVLAPFEDTHVRECVLNRTDCPHGPGCHSRSRCLALSEEIDLFLRATSIADLAGCTDV